MKSGAVKRNWLFDLEGNVTGPMQNRKMICEGIIEEHEGELVLVGGKCKKCGRISYPAKPICVACGSEEIGISPLSKRGAVYSYSTTMRPTSKLEAPCTFAYIDLPEGVRLFAPMLMEEGETLKIGSEAEIVFCELWEDDGIPVLGYRFRQAREETTEQ